MTQHATNDHRAHERCGGAARGSTLIELSAAIGVAAIATATVLATLAELERGTRVLAARQIAAVALEQGRRSSYLTASTVRVTATAGASELVVIDGEGVRDPVPLPSGARIGAAPALGAVRFFASGFADNATVELALAGGQSARVVVDQRGEIE